MSKPKGEMLRIEGHAIVSSQGMIADSTGLMPNSLKFEADLKLFEESLDNADLLVHGRMSHEGQANSASRRRLLMTRAVRALEPDPEHRNVWFWNPAGASLDEAARSLGLTRGLIAILGGTAAYDMFLNRYSAFYLSKAAKVSLDKGVPVFSAVGTGRTPEEILRAGGLTPEPMQVLDARHKLTQVRWVRR